MKLHGLKFFCYIVKMVDIVGWDSHWAVPINFQRKLSREEEQIIFFLFKKKILDV